MPALAVPPGRRKVGGSRRQAGGRSGRRIAGPAEGRGGASLGVSGDAVIAVLVAPFIENYPAHIAMYVWEFSMGRLSLFPASSQDAGL